MRRLAPWLGVILLHAVVAEAGPPKAAAAPNHAAGSATATSRSSATASAKVSATASAAPSSTAAAPHDALKSTASELFDKGVTAAAESRWEDCRAALLAAWSIHPSYQIAGNLAECEVKLGRNADAAEHLRFFLREVPADAPAERKARGETLMKEVRPKVAELSVRVNKADADVLVDGKSVGRSPLASSVFVEPGAHKMEAKLDGATAHAEVTATGGGTQEVTVPFEEPKKVESNRTPAHIAFGVGGAGLLLGAITGAAFLVKRDDFTAGCDAQKVCAASARGDFDTALMLSRVSTGAVVVAGLGAALGATFVVLENRKRQQTTGIVVGPGFFGVKGAF